MRSFFLGKNRSIFSLQFFYFFVRFKKNKQVSSQFFCFFQKSDMSDVQNIEASPGQNNQPPFFPGNIGNFRAFFNSGNLVHTLVPRRNTACQGWKLEKNAFLNSSIPSLVTL